MYKFYQSYKNDKLETQKKINEIIENYDAFIVDSDNITTIRDNIYNEVFSNNYYEEMDLKYSEWKQILNNYESSITALDSKFKVLKDECKNIRIMNSEINTKCGSFNNNYETIINLFVNDIEMFNYNIDLYNEWIIEQELEDKTELEYYVSTNYTDYIDYNSDGKYRGMQNEEGI